MTIKLRILKTLSGDEIVYDFNLWDGLHSPITAQKSIENTRYEIYKSAIQSIQVRITEFKAQLVLDEQLANEKYQDSITRWVKDISTMIMEQFLPETKTPFAQAMMKLELQAKEKDIVVEIATNDYLVPWWISRSYTANSWQEIWNALFIIGFSPAHLNVETTRPELPENPRIALISRPSNDLKRSTDIENKLKDNDLFSEINLLDGKKNTAPDTIKRFGLLRKEIESAVSDNQVLLYYGHFELDEKFPEKSYIEALQEYGAGRKEIEIPPEKISLQSLQKILEGKILFLDACRSIGLPTMSKDNFPKNESVLPNFYLSNKIICIGTIYPIFDDAAVVYMATFIKHILKGNSLGVSMCEARKDVKQKGFPIFDWAPYVLIGSPLITIQKSERKI